MVDVAFNNRNVQELFKGAMKEVKTDHEDIVYLCKNMMPDICTIGESRKSLQEDVLFLSEAICKEFENSTYFRIALLSTLLAVVLEQPQKQPLIGLLILKIDEKNGYVSAQILDFFASQLQTALNATHTEDWSVHLANEGGPWNATKQILRLLSILSPLLYHDDLITIYKNLLNLSINLNNVHKQTRNPLSELIFHNTLLNIPYLFIFERSDEILIRNFETLLKDFERRYNFKKINYNLLQEVTPNVLVEMIDLENVILPGVRMILSDLNYLDRIFHNWGKSLTGTWRKTATKLKVVIPTLEEVKPFASLSITRGSIDNLWKSPRCLFKVFQPSGTTSIAALTQLTPFHTHLLQDIVIDIVQNLEFNREEVAKQIMSLDLFFQNGLFVQVSSSSEKNTMTFEGNTSLMQAVKIENLVIEAILSLLFKLPYSTKPFAYYYTLLVEICQNSPKIIAPVFGKAFRFFYHNLSHIDIELRLIFHEWFSIQLSNFNFSWKWNEWENDYKKLNKQIYNPQMIFISNVIAKELRLTSNSAEVEESLPQCFTKFISPTFISVRSLNAYYNSFFSDNSMTLEFDEKLRFFYLQDDFPYQNFTERIIEYFHLSSKERHMGKLFDIVNTLKENYKTEISNFDHFIISLLIQCLCFSGRRSLSHANKYIDDFADDLKAIFKTLILDRSIIEFTIVQAILRFWNTSSQTGFLITNTVKFKGLVSSKAILEFILTEAENRNFALTDYTAVECIFKNLDDEQYSYSTKFETYQYIFRELCKNLNKTLEVLKYSSEMSDKTKTHDLDWKRLTTLNLLKSLLRRYANGYHYLTNFLKEEVKNISHDQTRSQLSQWIEELRYIAV
ncbi:hypothetical protein KAFR_0D02800 [Kazachstania africana CBS 2517]|uniref:MIF4G domain-containing protein n=1 Tax=Kazachstania africana (strain ATCC 22294 / BCRC 22015 / CBS 2517 / CECT 1963 / NBRC 1671 / NRRL Y-8276) TaxID=1071382 RepID=H2AU78_KAZAF|nr:hypothetical protein KAFR_0D02800 [Kazachstania africana CBS 2517]CCF57928.1 hypothetical protein KAFR_0D02800 [Kazachstania africana CBS 2517]